LTTEYFIIKDNCRRGFIKYLEKAFSVIPEFTNPGILDIGCGTGVPTLWLADKYSGPITAIDTDSISLDWLQRKANSKNFSKRLTTVNISFFNFKTDPNNFDIILAEGFLNVVGFETGFLRIIKLLKRNGYLIIHDEFKDHEKKCEFIQNNNCSIVDSFYLDEKIWWDDYYKKLETEITNKDNSKILNLFKSDIKEIEYYKSDPSAFRSIYYIIKKQ
jgi:cyclopropane fatty-acyl-phospholipid synthase-like methyltransferase